MTTTVLLRIEDVAERTGIPVETLRHWRKQGRGPRFVRLGRRLVCRASDLETWIDEQFSETA